MTYISGCASQEVDASEVAKPDNYVAHVPVPTQEEIEKMLVDRQRKVHTQGIRIHRHRHTHRVVIFLLFCFGSFLFALLKFFVPSTSCQIIRTRPRNSSQMHHRYESFHLLSLLYSSSYSFFFPFFPFFLFPCSQLLLSKYLSDSMADEDKETRVLLGQKTK
jgi:hypothetical protein